MIVLSTNPIVRDILDKSLVMVREHFYKDDSLLFKDSVAICFIDNVQFKKEKDFVTHIVDDICKSKKIREHENVKNLVNTFLENEKIELVDIRNGERGSIVMVLFKIKGVSINIPSKKISADIKRLINNIIVLFARIGIIEKVPENISETVDSIYEKVKTILVATGSVKRVTRDWSTNDGDPEEKIN